MVRTQVYLTAEIVRGIKALAKRERRPSARVIRELLTDALARTANDAGPLDTLIGRYHSGHSDTSQRVDEVLYGRQARSTA